MYLAELDRLIGQKGSKCYRFQAEVGIDAVQETFLTLFLNAWFDFYRLPPDNINLNRT